MTYFGRYMEFGPFESQEDFDTWIAQYADEHLTRKLANQQAELRRLQAECEAYRTALAAYSKVEDK